VLFYETIAIATSKVIVVYKAMFESIFDWVNKKLDNLLKMTIHFLVIIKLFS